MLVSVTDARALGYTRCLKKEWGRGERREERGVEKKERNTIIVYVRLLCIFQGFENFRRIQKLRRFTNFCTSVDSSLIGINNL